jgi:hypothetical protein
VAEADCFATVQEGNLVAAPFGLRSGLRQRGVAFGAAFTARLKPGPSGSCLNQLFAPFDLTPREVCASHCGWYPNDAGYAWTARREAESRLSMTAQ